MVFFTVVTHLRRPILTTSTTVELLRQAFREEMGLRPFTIDSIVVLPEHLHTIWRLPDGDSRFSIRWSKIKGRFTGLYLDGGGHEANPGASRVRRGERGVWQRRFWDRVVRNEAEYEALTNYIHWNPVTHGYASCPHAWPHSSFHRWVARDIYPGDWLCCCGGQQVKTPAFDGIESLVSE